MIDTVSVYATILIMFCAVTLALVASKYFENRSNRKTSVPTCDQEMGTDQFVELLVKRATETTRYMPNPGVPAARF